MKKSSKIFTQPYGQAGGTSLIFLWSSLTKGLFRIAKRKFLGDRQNFWFKRLVLLRRLWLRKCLPAISSTFWNFKLILWQKEKTSQNFIWYCLRKVFNINLETRYDLYFKISKTLHLQFGKPALAFKWDD